MSSEKQEVVPAATAALAPSRIHIIVCNLPSYKQTQIKDVIVYDLDKVLETEKEHIPYLKASEPKSYTRAILLERVLRTIVGQFTPPATETGVKQTYIVQGFESYSGEWARYIFDKMVNLLRWDVNRILFEYTEQRGAFFELPHEIVSYEVAGTIISYSQQNQPNPLLFPPTVAYSDSIPKLMEESDYVFPWDEKYSRPMVLFTYNGNLHVIDIRDEIIIRSYVLPNKKEFSAIANYTLVACQTGHSSYVVIDATVVKGIPLNFSESFWMDRLDFVHKFINNIESSAKKVKGLLEFKLTAVKPLEIPTDPAKRSELVKQIKVGSETNPWSDSVMFQTEIDNGLLNYVQVESVFLETETEN